MFIRENSDHSRFRGKVNLKGPLGLQWLNLWEVWAVKVAGFFWFKWATWTKPLWHSMKSCWVYRDPYIGFFQSIYNSVVLHPYINLRLFPSESHLLSLPHSEWLPNGVGNLWCATTKPRTAFWGPSWRLWKVNEVTLSRVAEDLWWSGNLLWLVNLPPS